MTSSRPLILSTFLLTLLTTCQQPLPCAIYKQRFYKEEAVLIVLDKGPDGRECLLKGIHPVSHKAITYYDESGFYLALKPLIAIGDTLVKEKGTAVFLIKKCGTNIELDYPCAEVGQQAEWKPVVKKK